MSALFTQPKRTGVYIRSNNLVAFYSTLLFFKLDIQYDLFWPSGPTQRSRVGKIAEHLISEHSMMYFRL